MPKATPIVTDLLGRGIEFGEMPNEELSRQRGIIRSVRVEDGKPIYTIQLLATDKLVDWKGNELIKLTTPGVPL